MNISFLYPSNPLNYRQVDDHYEEEYNVAKEIGLKVHLIEIENIAHSKIIPLISQDTKIVYRGWMLHETAYTQLEERFGSQLITSKKDYLNAHHLPNWYKVIEFLTIPSIITDEEHAQEEFIKFQRRAFIKDYVKSLKTGKGSIVDSPEDIKRAIADMKYYRGTIEGGIVLRNFINIKPNSETRFFVINNTIFSPIKNTDKYPFVEKVVNQLKLKNLKFYSVDIATTQDDTNIVIEIGDGQVSDYVGWNIKDFIQALSYFRNT